MVMLFLPPQAAMAGSFLIVGRSQKPIDDNVNDFPNAS
jgi:hypothetical protein